jgi:hypothetical protein
MEQIRNAISESQFQEVASKILSSPEKVLQENPSIMQINAANLQIKIQAQKRAISGMRIDLKVKEFSVGRGRMNHCPSGPNEHVSFEDFVQTQRVWSSKLRVNIQNHFGGFLNNTECVEQSRYSWLKYVSQFRNTLRNNAARIQLLRIKIAEYSSYLQGFEIERDDTSSDTDDMALEIRLRMSALDTLSSCLDRIE